MGPVRLAEAIASAEPGVGEAALAAVPLAHGGMLADRRGHGADRGRGPAPGGGCGGGARARCSTGRCRPRWKTGTCRPTWSRARARRCGRSPGARMRRADAAGGAGRRRGGRAELRRRRGPGAARARPRRRRCGGRRCGRRRRARRAPLCATHRRRRSKRQRGGGRGGVPARGAHHRAGKVEPPPAPGDRGGARRWPRRPRRRPRTPSRCSTAWPAAGTPQIARCWTSCSGGRRRRCAIAPSSSACGPRRESRDGRRDAGRRPRRAADDGGARLASGARRVSALTMLSRLLGLVREQIFAVTLGAGVYSDAFLAAFRIPNLLRDLFAEGALSTAFVPTYVATLRQQSRPAAFALANRVMSTLTIYLGAGRAGRDAVPRPGRAPGRHRVLAGEGGAVRDAGADHDAVPAGDLAGGGGDGRAQRRGEVHRARAGVVDVQPRRDHRRRRGLAVGPVAARGGHRPGRR